MLQFRAVVGIILDNGFLIAYNNDIKMLYKFS